MRFSQYEEEDIIKKFFGRDFKGTFLDLGAADGVRGSNTRALAMNGWRGCMVEPHPGSFESLFQNYWNFSSITLVNAAITVDARTVEFFHHADQLSTIYVPTTKLRHMAPHFQGKYWIPSITPKDVHTIMGKPPVDFVSLDCEGADLEIAWASYDLLRQTRLLCYETTLPGEEPSADYDAKWKEVLGYLGFRRVVGKTDGNTLVSK